MKILQLLQLTKECSQILNKLKFGYCLLCSFIYKSPHLEVLLVPSQCVHLEVEEVHRVLARHGNLNNSLYDSMYDSCDSLPLCPGTPRCPVSAASAARSG